MSDCEKSIQNLWHSCVQNTNYFSFFRCPSGHYLSSDISEMKLRKQSVVMKTNLIIFRFFEVQVGITCDQDFRNETAKPTMYR